MRAWLWMLGGLVVWAAHFTGLYALASVADVVAQADDLTFRILGMAFSLGCVIVLAAIGAAAVRRLQRAKFLGDEIALGGALLGALAVFWQSLPLMVGH